MTVEQLTEIIKTVDKTKIISRLTSLGYIYCNKDRSLGKVGIIELIRASKIKTEDIVDTPNKRLFNGSICGEVKYYENYEFLYINVYDVKPSTNPFDNEETAIQTDMLIFANKIE